MRRAIFLDRDGVINPMVYNSEHGLVDSPANPDEFELLPDVGEAIRLINQMGFLAIVVSNQPGLAKGKYTKPLLEATTQKMHCVLAQAGARLDAVYYCLHHPTAWLREFRLECDCRKPKPGLLLRAAQEWNIDLLRSYVVGDGVTDVVVAQVAGSISCFVSSRKCYVCDELARHGVRPDYIVGSLFEAVKVIQRLEAGDRLGVADYVPTCSTHTAPGATLATRR